MSITVEYADLQSASGWTKEWDTSINPVKPDGYELIQIPDGMRMYCCGPPYAGWLAKLVNPLLAQTTKMSFFYSLLIDDCTQQQGQVVETDNKITDNQGWTYDLSAQWNIPKGWMFQVQDPWKDTGITIPAPTSDKNVEIKIDYLLDYSRHTSSITTVTANGVSNSIPQSLQNYPAKQVGWDKSQIVTQMQQCTNGKRGAYSIKFPKISIKLLQ